MLRKIKQSMKAWWRRNVVADDPAPGYSRLDRLDGLGSLTVVEAEEQRAHMSRLAAPLYDTGLLAAALSDGDNHVLRDEVYVTPTGGLFHHDLGGAR